MRKVHVYEFDQPDLGPSGPSNSSLNNSQGGARKWSRLQETFHPQPFLPDRSHGSKGSPTNGMMTVVERIAGDGQMHNFDLWLAAKMGKIEDVKKALEQKHSPVQPDWELPDTDLDALKYKTRAVCCQAIHAAAACPCRGKEEPAKEIIELLLAHRADAKAKARINSTNQKEGVRELEAIHIAAGSGNEKTIRLLIESRAQPDAQATIGGKPHYSPIHDAAWFNKKNSIRLLLELRAKFEDQQKDGNTALHIAAQLGYEEVVVLLMEDQNVLGTKERQRLVKTKNKLNEIPLDCALKKGRFPPRSLYLFTDCLDEAGRAHAFMKVAKACPDATPALLRLSNSLDGDAGNLNLIPVHPQWCKSLCSGVRSDLITVQTLAALIQHSPQAAVDLMDALTHPPDPVSREHHPVPIRAYIPHGHEACRLSCAYEMDLDWHWDPSSGKGMPWHKRFAPENVRRGREVEVKVVHLKGIMDIELIHCLAESNDYRIFTKLVVHGLLKFMWQQLSWIFVLDLLHEVLALAVVCSWIWGSWSPGIQMQHNMWCIVASQGLCECANFLVVGATCLGKLGSEKFVWWASRSWHRLAIGCSTMALVIETQSNFGPRQGSGPVLAINGFLQWLLLLFELRAFQWTGKRIMPIIKSITPIAGMLVIMFFVSLAFLHAFWAMERDAVTEISFFNIVVLLFTGEHFLSGDDLEAMDPAKRDFTIALSILGVFIFLTCTINVFIAVLGDCYDQEQERMISTFLRERARICSGLFLRPKSRIARPFFFETAWQRCLLGFFVVALLVGQYVLLLVFLRKVGLLVWAPAVYIWAAVSGLQSIQLDFLTMEWKERYLWICHEASVDEDDFLAPDERSAVESYGRIARIKSYVLEQCRTLGRKSKAETAKVREQVVQKADSIHEMLKVLSEALDVDPLGSFPMTPVEDLVIPPDTEGSRWRGKRASGAKKGDAGGVTSRTTEAAALTDISHELARVKHSLNEMCEQMAIQCDAQGRLEATCLGVAQALQQVVEVAHSRRRQVDMHAASVPQRAARKPNAGGANVFDGPVTSTSASSSAAVASPLSDAVGSSRHVLKAASPASALLPGASHEQGLSRDVPKAAAPVSTPLSRAIQEQGLSEDVPKAGSNHEPSAQEIEEYAKRLEIDVEKDQDLLWIAKAGLKASLPPPWKACHAKCGEAGRVYHGFTEHTYRLAFPFEDKFAPDKPHLFTIVPSGIVENSRELEPQKEKGLIAFAYPQSISDELTGLPVEQQPGSKEDSSTAKDGNNKFIRDTAFVWRRQDGTNALVQTWPTNLNEKFRQDFEISEGVNPDSAKFQPQAVSEFQEAMVRLFGPTAASCPILFCHKKLVSTSPAVVGLGEEVLAHIKEHPDLMRELAIASIDSDGLGFVADGTNGKGQKFEKNFRVTTGEKCVVYRKTGWDTMGCIKLLHQFLNDAEFHEPPTLHGDIYYFNLETGECVWEHPCDTIYWNLFKSERAKKCQVLKNGEPSVPHSTLLPGAAPE